MQSAITLSISANRGLRGELTLQGDKSLSHRALLFAAIAEGQSTIERFLVSGVTNAMLGALRDLGVEWQLDGTRLTVHGRGLHGFTTPPNALYCGNSATTMRLLAGAMAAAGIPCVLDGSPGLRKRPMNRIAEPLAQMQVPITTNADCAPLTLAARPPQRALKALEYTLPMASAQVKTCLMLAALAGDGVTTIREPEPSRDHTERMLRAMGAEIESDGSVVRIHPIIKPLAPLNITLPGDISSAAFMLVAAALVPGSDITIRDVGINPTRTGILDALQRMGAALSVENQSCVAGEPIGDIRLKAAPLKAINLSGEIVVRMIDELPAFAVAACFAAGTTTLRDAEELRYKETDRISVLCTELKKIGVKLSEQRDGFDIQGGTLRGGLCQAHGDHRLAMSLALAGVAAPEPVVVQNAEILSESFPDFTMRLKTLGAQIKEV